jgi:hypothetical protein
VQKFFLVEWVYSIDLFVHKYCLFIVARNGEGALRNVTGASDVSLKIKRPSRATPGDCRARPN